MAKILHFPPQKPSAPATRIPALEVCCSECGADVQNPCTGWDGKAISGFHSDRLLRAAQKIVSKKTVNGAHGIAQFLQASQKK
jgi:hypothetical protein